MHFHIRFFMLQCQTFTKTLLSFLHFFFCNNFRTMMYTSFEKFGANGCVQILRAWSLIRNVKKNIQEMASLLKKWREWSTCWGDIFAKHHLHLLYDGSKICCDECQPTVRFFRSEFPMSSEIFSRGAPQKNRQNIFASRVLFLEGFYNVAGNIRQYFTIIIIEWQGEI